MIVQTFLGGISMAKNKTTALISAVFASTVLLSGCGLFENEVLKKIDPPKDVAISKEMGKISSSKEAAASIADAEETVKTELYLIDKGGYVVPQTIPLPKTAPVATQALDYLVADGPISEMLPNGFRAALPAGTDVSVNIKDGVASVDFSKEFKNYKAADEMKILQSITWTLTQFPSVKSVKLSMAGQALTKMPVNGSPISENLSRASGINLDTSDVMDITNTKPLTVYYIGGVEGSYYYVPVTRRISNNVKDPLTAVVDELVKGPGRSSNLATEFMPDVKLLEAPKVENGEVTLNFNENIFGSFEEKVISQHLVDSLVLSLTEQTGIEQVAICVKGKAELVNELGKRLTEPVSRPEKVNTGNF